MNECRVSEETGEHRTEIDSVHSDDQDDVCSSSDLVDTKFCEQEVEKTDDLMFDGEFAQDIELMKSMGLPLSFTQASERRRKKVCICHIKHTDNEAVSNLWCMCLCFLKKLTFYLTAFTVYGADYGTVLFSAHESVDVLCHHRSHCYCYFCCCYHY